MKVAFITTESLIDHSYTMICGLRKHIELEVFIVAKKMTPEIEEFCTKLNARFYKRKRFINPLGFFDEMKLLRAIKKLKADLVWFNTLSLAQAVLLRLFIRRPLINAHDIEYHPEERDYHGIFSQKVTFRIFRNCIAVMSRSQAVLFKQQYGFEPYILNLPIIDYYEAMAKDKLKTKEKSNRVRFLFFGNILPYKGIEKLIRAAEILDAKHAEYELNIFGRLRYNIDELSHAIRKLRNTNFQNRFIDYGRVYEAYSENDIIIIPYIQVTQCGPLLIGYNQDMPCITSDHPGFREYADDGSSGLIFDNTAEDLAEKMETVISDRGMIDKMSGYISSEIKSRFSMESLAESYLKVFQKHLANIS